ncbi:MAG TPA: glycine betaine ABC transporter substrate-binding protein [Candidatus Dormibacteraeota bacterium]
MRAPLALAALTAVSLLVPGCGGGGGSASPVVCIMSEFRTRADGVPGLARTYGAGYGSANYKDIGSTAEAGIASGQCAAGEVFTTDSAVAANNLYVLRDDKGLFPPDNVGLVVRSQMLRQHPGIGAILAPVAIRITTDEITRMNRAVEVDKRAVADVAGQWLRSNALLDAAPAVSGAGSDACPASATSVDGGGAQLKIGSKPFAEEELLATIAKLVLERHGYRVDDSVHAADPAIDRALRDGTVDMLWQYTGTELQEFLNVKHPPAGLDAAFAEARSRDEPNGLCWVAPAPMNDTNGVAIRAADRSRYGDTLSAFGSYLASSH